MHLRQRQPGDGIPEHTGHAALLGPGGYPGAPGGGEPYGPRLPGGRLPGGRRPAADGGADAAGHRLGGQSPGGGPEGPGILFPCSDHLPHGRGHRPPGGGRTAHGGAELLLRPPGGPGGPLPGEKCGGGYRPELPGLLLSRRGVPPTAGAVGCPRRPAPARRSGGLVPGLSAGLGSPRLRQLGCDGGGLAGPPGAVPSRRQRHHPSASSLSRGELLGDGPALAVCLPRIRDREAYRRHVYDTILSARIGL